MKLPTTIRSATALACGFALAAAPSAQLPEVSLTLSQDAYEAGQTIELTLEAEPFQIPILFLGRGQGPTLIPGVGEFGMGLTPLPKWFILKMLNATGTRTLTCEVDCETAFRELPKYLQVLTVDPFTGDYSGLSNPVALQQVSGDCGPCVDPAIGDEVGGNAGGHAIWLPGIDKDLVFVSGGDFVERSDGTAMLKGVVASKNDPSRSFAVDVMFSDRVDPLDPTPAGSPKKELKSQAYIENGGPIDPRDWRYYETVEGVLMGLDCFEGAVVEVSRRGPAFQVGLGANGKNVNFGGSGWLDWTVLEQPDECETFKSSGTGDINIDVGGDCVDCATEASDHAITMKAFGNDFLFISGGEFIERPDGTAVLAGTLENDNDPNNRWVVEVLFSDRVNPGAANYPPAGSPKKELGGSNYSENGGIVDTSTWHYYETVVGTLVGEGGNLGLDLVIERRGPAFQVGLGASGKNAEYGASGWIDVFLTQDGSDSIGDININLEGDCE